MIIPHGNYIMNDDILSSVEKNVPTPGQADAHGVADKLSMEVRT